MREVRNLNCRLEAFLIFGLLVRLLREELQLLHEPGSYVGEVVKVMGKNKVLVKVQPEGKYSMFISGHAHVSSLTK
jgi:26S proteasome regulatory subunit T6